MPHDLLSFQRDFAAAVDADAAGAMAIYRNTVFHGAVEALRANFPVTAQIVGEEMFEGIAVDFSTECPPRHPVLAFYGARFADWLEKQPWLGDVPYLADVARVERLHLECLFAADAEPLPREPALTAMRQPSMRLRLHPAVRFGWFATPAMTIWLAHQRPMRSPIAPDWKAEGALFVRPEPFRLHAPRIGRAAHRILAGLRLEEPLDAALAAAATLYPEEDGAAVFASLVNLGAFVAPIHGRSLQ